MIITIIIYANIFRHIAAKPLYQKGLAIQEKTIGKNHPNCAASLNDLAYLYATRGHYRKAKKYSFFISRRTRRNLQPPDRLLLLY
jgi:hypothetical protein